MTIAIALKGANSIVLATDSKGVRWVIDSDGSEHLRHQDNITKLCSLNDYIGVMFASNVAGYEQWVVELFNETTTDRNSKPFREVVELFAKKLNEDFHNYVRKEQTMIVTESILVFVLCGYNLQNEPRIVQISWTRSDRLFIPQLVPLYHWTVGAPDISNYLVSKFEDHLPNMNTTSLQRLATLLITETSTTEDSVDDKVQMAVIEKGEKLRFIATDEIEKLKSEVSTIIDKEELLNRLIGKRSQP